MTLFERSCDWAAVHLLNCSIYEYILFREPERISMCAVEGQGKSREVLDLIHMSSGLLFFT